SLPPPPPPDPRRAPLHDTQALHSRRLGLLLVPQTLRPGPAQRQIRCRRRRRPHKGQPGPLHRRANLRPALRARRAHAPRLWRAALLSRVCAQGAARHV
ncbi:hypothetical protein BN1723_020525, partial [Verticillium longisporum]